MLLGPHRSESKSAASRYSPGLVESTEIVLRTILDPDHLEGGTLKQAAISLDDIRFRGWSVDRKKYSALRQLNSFHLKWKEERRALQKPQINKFYVLPILVSEIRLSPENKCQEFVVTDSALCGKPGHASVLLSTPHAQSSARKIRDRFLDRLPKYVDVENVFNPEDKSGYIWGMLSQSVVFLGCLRRFRNWRCFFFLGR